MIRGLGLEWALSPYRGYGGRLSLATRRVFFVTRDSASAVDGIY